MPNTSEDVIFRRGPSATIPQEKVPGTILIETDTGNMYVDDTEESRVQIKDSTKMAKFGTVDTSTNKTVIHLDAGTGGGASFEIPSSNFQILASNFLYNGDGLATFNNASGIDVSGVTLKGGSSQSLTFQNNRGVVSGLKVPTNNNDATNKQYVDGLYTNLESEIVTTAAQYLPLKGGTMTGSIDMGNSLITSLGTPQSDTDAANKQYVDSELESYLPLSGGTMSGDINFGSNAVTVYGKGVMTKGSSYTITNSSGRAVLATTGDNISLGNSNGLAVLQGSTTNLTGNTSVSLSTPQLTITAAQTDLTASQIDLTATGGVFNFHCTDSESTRVILNFDTTSAGGALLRGIAEPLNSDDAANKQYVDSKFAAGGGDFMADGSVQMTGNLKINVGGENLVAGTSSDSSYGWSYRFSDTSGMFADEYGNLCIKTGTGLGVAFKNGLNQNARLTIGDPTADSEAATKRYVDQAVSSAGGGDFLADGSVPMTGNLNLDSHKITNLAIPTANTDAANKAYVDSKVGNPYTPIAYGTSETTTGSTILGIVGNGLTNAFVGLVIVKCTQAFTTATTSFRFSAGTTHTITNADDLYDVPAGGYMLLNVTSTSAGEFCGFINYPNLDDGSLS